ncbi:putative chitobiose transport system substrate-binding protein [Deinobacterium chartae]|uniref:Putative chitobiose transport system substrate-binding protein n=1 Tax=Deinobacterium chartae TaxID=521158 RepID=A0A841I1B0_9DEIO|nr:sugar ABC transporter substrate-binding protein [Deinobacterium chartae]MBB6097862.1 putative chitobiose transport system substrate-binding protein [Deinobacterium chartae]
MKRTLLLAAALSLGAAQAQKTELEYWTLSLKPFFTDLIEGQIKAFEKANPQYSVRWTDVPFDAVQQKLLSAIASGRAPDVVNLNAEMVTGFYAQGALEPLNAIAPKGALNTYLPRAKTAFTFDKQLYAVPWYWAPKVVAYNSEIFKKAGLSRPPRTTNELLAAAKTIKDKTGNYGFVPDLRNLEFLYLFREEGLPVLSKDGKRAVFNSPEHVKVIQTYLDLYKKGYIPEEAISKGYVAATELYGSGKLGMLITGPQFLIRVENDNKAAYDLTRVTSYPLGAGKVAHTPLMALAVPKASKNKEAAAKLATFMTDDTRQLEFAKATSTFPSTSGAAKDRYFTEGGKGAINESRLMMSRNIGSAEDLNVTVPEASRLHKAFKDGIESIFFNNRDIKATLDDVVRTWNAALAQ